MKTLPIPKLVNNIRQEHSRLLLSANESTAKFIDLGHSLRIINYYVRSQREEVVVNIPDFYGIVLVRRQSDHLDIVEQPKELSIRFRRLRFNGEMTWDQVFPIAPELGTIYTACVDVEPRGLPLIVLNTEQVHSSLLRITGSGEQIRMKIPYDDVLYWNSSLNKAVVSKQRGPMGQELSWFDIQNNSIITQKGRWLCADHTRICVATDTEFGSVLYVIDAASLEIQPMVTTELPVTAGAFVSKDYLALVRNEHGVQNLIIQSIQNEYGCQQVNGVGGFLSLGRCCDDALYVTAMSLLEGTSWCKVYASGEVSKLAGKVPPVSFPALRVSPQLSEIEVLSYQTDHPKAAVISLHGGPESCEFDELRFGGLYRQLLYHSVDVWVLNYAGSSLMGEVHRCKPWHRWNSIFRQEFLKLIDYINRVREIGPQSIVVLGGSFGGSLALLAGTYIRLSGIVAVSPLVDLENHMARLASDTNYSEWFLDRFGQADMRAITFENFLRITCPVTVITGSYDDILDLSATKRLVNIAQQRRLPWHHIAEPMVGHASETGWQDTIRKKHIADAVYGSLRT